MAAVMVRFQPGVGCQTTPPPFSGAPCDSGSELCRLTTIHKWAKQRAVVPALLCKNIKKGGSTQRQSPCAPDPCFTSPPLTLSLSYMRAIFIQYLSSPRLASKFNDPDFQRQNAFIMQSYQSKHSNHWNICSCLEFSRMYSFKGPL